MTSPSKGLPKTLLLEVLISAAMRSGKVLHLFFLFHSSTVFFSEGNSESDPRSSYFKTLRNKQLLGYAVKRFSSPSLLSCGQRCLMASWCTSTNFRLFSEKDGRGTCELNSHNISVSNENFNVEDREQVTFSLRLKGCQLAFCLNGGSCLHEKENQTFSCSCQYPWTGDRCENKMGNSTCKEIYYNKLADGNKAYLLQIGSEKVPVYCHMTSLGECGGYGWTLVMKMNGSLRTFHYDDVLWSNYKPFNLEGGKTGFDSNETKLPTYWDTSFTRICLGMKIGEQENFFTAINKSASSLYSLIADGKYRATSLGRTTWKKLIGSRASLQRNCNKEGFNAVGENHSHSKARIGYIANQENDCRTCDSRIGFGTGGYHDDSNTCGNQATHNPDNGNKNIRAMGYILVQ